ncbi:ABC transporter substrate-binding protein [soil metagenome]
MSEQSLNAESLVEIANNRSASRRGFMKTAAALGLAAPLGSLLWQGAQAGPAATGRSFQFSAQDGGKTLVVSIPQQTVQLDPGLAGGNGYGDIIPITDNITEGLTRFKLGSGEIEPGLAESWTPSEDGLTFTFTLRQGVTFHDGTPFNADAVLFNVNRQIDPTAVGYSDQFIYAGIVFQDVASVAKTGEYEVAFTLNRPITPLLPGNLAVFAGGIVSPTAAQDFADDYSQNAAGTGPFKLDAFTPDVELSLVANDDYWGGRPALDRVVFRTISEDAVRLSELKAGSIDVANQIDLKDVESVEGEDGLGVISGSFFNVQYVAFNQTIAPFDNPDVRKAFEFAINKQNIADVVFYGNYTLGAGPIAPGLLGYDETLTSTYTYDPDQAKALLEGAGAADLEFDFYARTNTFWPTISQLIQADLDAVGVKANIVALEDAEFFGAIDEGTVPVFVNDWTWDNGDPDNVIYSLFFSERAVSRVGYNNPDVDKLILDAQIEADPAARTELYKQIQAQVLADAVHVVLGYPARAIGIRDAVTNLQLSPLGSLVLREVDLAN